MVQKQTAKKIVLPDLYTQETMYLQQIEVFCDHQYSKVLKLYCCQCMHNIVLIQTSGEASEVLPRFSTFFSKTLFRFRLNLLVISELSSFLFDIYTVSYTYSNFLNDRTIGMCAY